jgi:cyclin B
MPAKGEFSMQPKFVAPRTRASSGNGAVRSARGNCENANINIRRNVKLGLSATGQNSNYTASSNIVSLASALSDITNVAPSRSSQMEKASYPKTTGHSFQPQIATSADEKNDAPSAQSVHEYVPDITKQLFSEEALFLPRADLMDMQTDINAKMRMILIDWLIEVHMKYHLRPETLHLTVNLIDRFLSKVRITRKRLQLVGVVASFIASKFEEIHPPELHDWVYICDRAYTKQDILTTECTMLSTLSFQIMVPTAAHFFDVLEKANACDDVHRSLAQYLLELGLIDVRMLKYQPSHVVSAALLLSNELLRQSTVWPAEMVMQSHASGESLRTCADELRQIMESECAQAGGQLQALHKKFSTKERHEVAKMKF